jgi:hypothetical protein
MGTSSMELYSNIGKVEGPEGPTTIKTKTNNSHTGAENAMGRQFDIERPARRVPARVH